MKDKINPSVFVVALFIIAILILLSIRISTEKPKLDSMMPPYSNVLTQEYSKSEQSMRTYRISLNDIVQRFGIPAGETVMSTSLESSVIGYPPHLVTTDKGMYEFDGKKYVLQKKEELKTSTSYTVPGHIVDTPGEPVPYKSQNGATGLSFRVFSHMNDVTINSKYKLPNIMQVSDLNSTVIGIDESNRIVFYFIKKDGSVGMLRSKIPMEQIDTEQFVIEKDKQ